MGDMAVAKLVVTCLLHTSDKTPQIHRDNMHLQWLKLVYLFAERVEEVILGAGRHGRHDCSEVCSLLSDAYN